MNSDHTQWSKEELKIYILLLCAKADNVEDKAELDFIKTQTDPDTFEQMHELFEADEEEESLTKIQEAVAKHEYSNKELADLKSQIKVVFASDDKFHLKEHSMGLILDNILY